MDEIVALKMIAKLSCYYPTNPISNATAKEWANNMSAFEEEDVADALLILTRREERLFSWPTLRKEIVNVKFAKVETENTQRMLLKSLQPYQIPWPKGLWAQISDAFGDRQKVFNVQLGYHIKDDSCPEDCEYCAAKVETQ